MLKLEKSFSVTVHCFHCGRFSKSVYCCCFRERVEAGESEVLEFDSSTERWNRCKKHNGHRKFIPVNDFTPEYLPEVYRKNLYPFIRSFSQLTVCIKVNKISTDRPETQPHSEAPYPYGNRKGQDIFRTGSGMVWEVKHVTPGQTDEHGCCPCKECRVSGSPRSDWAMIKVISAPHVVFDKTECQDAIFVLFHDTEISQPETLDGFDVSFSSPKRDECILNCATHNPDLIRKLEKLWGDYFEQFFYLKEQPASNEAEKIVVIVSHPHGHTKHVSVGQWVDTLQDDLDTKHSYDTPTCPGSSGAPVLILGTKWRPIFHQHSGSDNIHNFCGEQVYLC